LLDWVEFQIPKHKTYYLIFRRLMRLD